MSAILEYMLQPGNEDVESIHLTFRTRETPNDENIALIIRCSPSITIERKKGEVLYTAGRKVKYKSEIDEKWLSQFTQTADDNVVREWLRASDYTEEEIEEELDKLKHGPREYREFYRRLGYTPEQIEKEMERLQEEGKIFRAPQLIPVGYRRERLEEEAIFGNPTWSNIYFNLSSIHHLEEVEVFRGKNEATVEYSLGVRMCPGECKVIRDTYLDLCKKYGYKSELHPRRTDKIILNPFKRNRFETIEFDYFDEVLPLSIRVIVPTNSDGIKILEELENMIGRFNPEEGDFSKNFERIILPRDS